MKTDPIAEAAPDSISPEDALTLALTNKRFARHVLSRTIKDAVQGQDGQTAGMHATTRRRLNAKAIRENKVKASELKNTGRQSRPQHYNRTTAQPLWDADQLRQKLQSYNRVPFLDLLAIWMECMPSPQTVMAFADKYPDRWTKALVDLGRLGGFADRKEIDLNFAAQVQNMSDSQLEDALRDHAYKLGIPLPALLTQLKQVHNTENAEEIEVVKVE